MLCKAGQMEGKGCLRTGVDVSKSVSFRSKPVGAFGTGTTGPILEKPKRALQMNIRRSLLTACPQPMQAATSPVVVVPFAAALSIRPT